MDSRFLHTGLFLLFIVSTATAQILSTSLKPSDWGITDPARIRIAQVSLVHSPEGEYLTVQAVYQQGAFSRTASANSSDSCLIVADFDHADVNRLGGSSSVFHSGSTTATLQQRLGPAGRQTMQLTFTKESDGYCGFWMHLFNSAAPENERVYFDATRFSALHISLRGESGNERIDLKIADDDWERKQDALLVGDLGRFLPTGRIDTVWQTAVIPAAIFPRRLDLTRLASVVLQLSGKRGTIELSSIAFSSGSAKPSRGVSQPLTGPVSDPERALWVWNTRDILNNDGEITALKAITAQEGISQVFLALPYDGKGPGAGKGVTIPTVPMKRLIRQLNASDLKVHALVGDKDFIRPDARQFVRSTMENIVHYQRTADPAEQFYGIHLDVEPYLLPGFASNRQSWFLEKFLDVLAECASSAREARMVIGADIPAWLDAPNELTHMPMDITWNGMTKPAYRHVMDIMDFVVLMDYRTTAGEIVTQAVAELRYGEKIGKEVFIGLETIPLYNETLLAVKGEPKRGFPDVPKGKVLCLVSRADDVLAAVISPGQQSALARLLSDNERTAKDLLWWPVSREINVHASRLTFAGDGGETKLRLEMQEAEAYLKNFRSFGGLSIHDYTGFRKLITE